MCRSDMSIVMFKINITYAISKLGNGFTKLDGVI